MSVWVKLESNYSHDERIRRAGDRAGFLLICANQFCNANPHTRGGFDESDLWSEWSAYGKRATMRKLLARLVDVGLVAVTEAGEAPAGNRKGSPPDPDGDPIGIPTGNRRGTDGDPHGKRYWVVDWEVLQSEAANKAAKRKKDRERKARQRAREAEATVTRDRPVTSRPNSAPTDPGTVTGTDPEGTFNHHHRSQTGHQVGAREPDRLGGWVEREFVSWRRRGEPGYSPAASHHEQLAKLRTVVEAQSDPREALRYALAGYSVQPDIGKHRRSPEGLAVRFDECVRLGKRAEVNEREFQRKLKRERAEARRWQ